MGANRGAVPPMLPMLRRSIHKLLSQISFSGSFVCLNPVSRVAPLHARRCEFAQYFCECLLPRVRAGVPCHSCLPNVTPNPEPLCGDSGYNICKPLPLRWISNGLETSFICSRTPAAGLVYSPPHTPCHTQVLHYVCVCHLFPTQPCICHTQMWS